MEQDYLGESRKFIADLVKVCVSVLLLLYTSMYVTAIFLIDAHLKCIKIYNKQCTSIKCITLYSRERLEKSVAVM